MLRISVRLAVLLTAVALCVAGLSTPAQAAPREPTPGYTITEIPAPGSSTPVKGGVTTQFGVDRRWYGAQIRFNAYETDRISLGGAVCASWVGRIPGWGWILAASCGTLSAWAGYARSQGDCLAVNVYLAGFVSPWKWDC